MRLIFMAFTSATLWAQSVQMPPSKATEGGFGALLIALKSPAGKETVALQWKLAVPAEVIIEPDDILAGSAAESAEKAITCAVTEKNAASGSRYSCVLAGGRKPLQDGPVAVIRYKIRDKARTGVVTVRMENILGVSANLKKIELANVEGTITIGAR
jgi:hypothetical protein